MTVNNVEFNQTIFQALNAETPEVKKRYINEAISMLYTTTTLTKWAHAIANSRGYRDPSGIMDIEQVIAEKILISLRQATAKNSDRVTDWVKFLYGLSVNAVKDYLASSQVTIASKMSGAMKRRDIVNRVTKELVASLHRQPTMEEVIANANAWALEHHKDAYKQGLIVTPEDFQSHTATPVSLNQSPGAMPSNEIETEMELSAEAIFVQRRMLEICDELHPDDENLPVLVKAWMGCIQDAERPSQALLSSVTGFSATLVRACLAKLNDVLEEIRLTQ